MSMFLLVNTEDKTIDSYRPHTSNYSPLNTQADNPGEDLVPNGAQGIPELPNPSVGGLPGSGIRNGYSTGFRSLFNRQQPFSGAVAKPPAISNPVVGSVGEGNRAGRLYAGVMNQLAAYTPSQLSYSAKMVGIADPSLPVKGA